MQEVTSPSAIMVTGIDQDGTVIELPTEAFTRAGQTGRKHLEQIKSSISYKCDSRL